MRELRPDTPQQLALLVREAEGAPRSVAMQGAGTWNPWDADVLLSASGLDRITDFSPRDLTVSVGAGVSLSALDSRLAEAGVWAAWDPPGGNRSVGSIVATGTDGPLVQGFGGIKDQLLGLTMVTGHGRVVTVGGRVMKNVAGFDLTRLSCGSFGALGIVTSVHLRLRPIPARDTTLFRDASRDSGIAALRTIAADRLNPAASQLSLTAESAPEWTLAVRFLGSDEAVAGDIRALERSVPGRWITGDWPVAGTKLGAGTTTVRLGCTVRTLSEVLDLLGAELGPGTVSASPSFVRWTGVAEALHISQLRLRARELGCPVTVERAPPRLLRQVGVFGCLDSAAAVVMSRLIDSFDPHGVFAAGEAIVSS